MYELLSSLSEFFAYFVWFFFVLAITFLIAKIVHSFLSHHVNKSSKSLRVDPTQYLFLRHLSTAIIFFIGLGLAIYTIPGFRSLAVSMFAGAGILAVVVGFAAQETLANLIAGVMIVVSRPYRVGDWIVIGNQELMMGTVEDISLRHTILRTRENKRLIVPNSVMGREQITNSHLEEEKTCHLFEIGISYDSDINLAMKIIEEEALSHPDLLDNRSEEDKQANKPIVRIVVIGFGDSSVRLRAWLWADKPFTAWFMGLDLNKRVKERFDKEGVEIPFPYRTVVYKKDLPKNNVLKKAKKTSKKKARKRSQ